ncbi:probable inactive receptor-like protein kinase At3g56050 [Abrus precatorius]|uniref:Probable inactive receptor-like protein kinase At3g56050 n=1 Tax=Abrus precatorius TaxID=3816 RepID=A0A8B8JHV4_ABRPR|nr:probable inactive receptor-like protein kinase At3g56050 [Abrus precatorius]XP_027331041.1 probable inactive receptor-like protein kinase At3g56050 [Abrus precatorius]
MSKNRKLIRFSNLCGLSRFLVVFLLFHNLGLCCSLNDEGHVLLKLRQRIVSDPFGALSNWIDDEAVLDPCNWFGVECLDGRVVVLNLKDLCLKGTLAPEIMNLVHIKSIILRNNSFFGTIPEGFVDLQELEILDLGYNNFSGHLPADLGSNISLAILLLDNNEFLVGFSPEINELKMLSECQVDENHLTNAAKMPVCAEKSNTWHIGQRKGSRGLLENNIQYRRSHEDPRNREANSPLTSPSPAASPSPQVQNSIPPKENAFHSPPSLSTPGFEPLSKSTSSRNHRVPIFVGVIGAVLLLITCIGIYLWKTDKVANVRPWATGLSGQLQKAFVTGVPKLKKSDLDAACEDFSNVIGTSPIGALYKGTLSSGVEIAVASIPKTSSKNWSKTLEAQFRKKVDTLSKVNHKNFINLIGYCEEEEPFTRMLVFEYAPNGTLFEHLHIKEAEHLDWGTRLRVAMGMAYCLQHMHQLDPPSVLIKLNSSTVYLTDDYAAKISDLSFPTEITSSAETKTGDRKHINTPIASPESNVYSFGVLLFEMITGRLPYTVEEGDSRENWASHYLQGDQPIKEIVDPILASYQEDQLEQLVALIKSCVQPDPEQRPKMKDVSERLREITKITAESAFPKLSPLWWAELEISSAEAR